MIDCINNKSAIFEAIKQWQSTSNETQESISRATGIHQSQVSRILSGKFLKLSSNVIKICKYANINITNTTTKPKDSAILMQALESTWDGSDSHAKSIAKVILALRHYKP